MPEHRTIGDIHPGSNEFWTRPLVERDEAFRALRAESKDGDGMCFHEEISVIEGAVKGPGFWSAVTYDDIREVNRKAQLFSSAGGITLGETSPETLEFFGSMIVMDDPRHAKFRMLVQKGFTPKTVAAIEESVRVRARELVDAAKRTDGEVDFVEAFAAPLPLQVICDMLGVPPEDEQQIFEWTNVILGAGDPDFALDLDGLITGAAGMFEYAQRLGEDRLEHPREDITSILMHAEVNGQRLTPAEFGSFFILLAVAGNETTRNAISWGMHQLTAHPDQRELLRSNFDELSLPAADEIVRWSSPVIHMRRVANEDVRVGSTEIAAGEKVVMWYWSGNRDEAVFEDGHRFDITRPNTRDMAGYGAGGPHFCLGANLARREIQVMYDAIFRELPDLEVTGEPDRLVSGFINGIKRMPCRFSV
ncbi:cytochrome P450 [Ilumatobacter sp.]|uniref:cytochrome P450 n=1 Tax=Ilumatobacter sp. TaxID=1967498 RepID=UPI003B522E2F